MSKLQGKPSPPETKDQSSVVQLTENQNIAEVVAPQRNIDQCQPPVQQKEKEI